MFPEILVSASIVIPEEPRNMTPLFKIKGMVALDPFVRMTLADALLSNTITGNGE